MKTDKVSVELHVKQGLYQISMNQN